MTPIQREIRKSIVYFLSLIIIALIFDAILHWAELVWIGRYLGIVGTILIILSFVYSLRKKKYISLGKVSHHLRFHEAAAWTGTVLILIHSGIHFNAVLPWLATIAMLVTTGSGLTGKYLLKKAQIKLKEQNRELMKKGLSKSEIDVFLKKEGCRVNIMKKWRKVHFPITFSFTFLFFAHFISILYYGWL